MDQGFTFPNRNQANWDNDINANFARIGQGFYAPGVVGPTFIASGHVVTYNSSGLLERFNPHSFGNQPHGLSYQVVSPGNTGYIIAWGGITSFVTWSGQLKLGAPFYASARTPGWVTSCLDLAGMFQIGVVGRQGEYLISPVQVPPARRTHVQCGFMNDSTVYSFALLHAGNRGINEELRIRTSSVNNYQVTLYSNSGRTDIFYQTQILSGNISVNTVDFKDAALFPYYSTDPNSPFAVYGKVEVLSSAATTVSSGFCRADFAALRYQ